MRLYRGIAVTELAATATIGAIRENGLAVGAGFWKLAVHDLKPNLDALWQSSALSKKLTRPEGDQPVSRICACAKRLDALYYACSHNRKDDHTASILIAFDVDVRDVIVDGRDFLYTVFQLGNPTASRQGLLQVFGPAILRYSDRAWATSEQNARIAYCDLAIQDAEVIAAHAANDLTIGGRYGTRFSSAFMVRAPVARENIVSVERVDNRGYVLPDIAITLDQALGR